MSTIDLRHQYTQMPKLRTPHLGAVLHHSARNILASANPVQEQARIAAIDRYHRSKRWSMGIGYSRVIFPSGRHYWVGDPNTSRAHVKDKNHLYEGWCIIGSYTCSEPTEAAQDAVRELLKITGLELLGGHREFQENKRICPGFWDIEKVKYPKPDKLGPISAARNAVQGSYSVNGRFLIPLYQKGNKKAYELRIPQ